MSTKVRLRPELERHTASQKPKQESNGWQERVRDPRERKLFEALSDPTWDFRTIDGLSKSTGSPLPEVEAVLSKYADLIRKSPLPNRNGRYLFSLRERPIRNLERILWIKSFVTKSLP